MIKKSEVFSDQRLTGFGIIPRGSQALDKQLFFFHTLYKLICHYDMLLRPIKMVVQVCERRVQGVYELIILGLLMRWPAHGYRIAHIINDMIGPYAKLSNGRLYPLLAKLEAEGLIVACVSVESEGTSGEAKGERQLRTYEITDDGRERFHRLMMDTTSNPGEYQKLFLQKAPLLYALKPAERLHLIDHYINYCQAHVLHLTAEAEDLASRDDTYMSQPQLEAILDVMQHKTVEWRLELDWVKSLHEKELAQAQVQN